MPMGIGTYGTKVGRPPAKKKPVKKKKVKNKQLDFNSLLWYNRQVHYLNNCPKGETVND